MLHVADRNLTLSKPTSKTAEYEHNVWGDGMDAAAAAEEEERRSEKKSKPRSLADSLLFPTDRKSMHEIVS